MPVDIGSRLNVAVSHPFLYVFQAATVIQQQTGATMPLRYNYDKPEKPRTSRVFGYLARFFILFQTEKSSREVVISQGGVIVTTKIKYAEYRKAREKMKELLTAKANIDRILELDKAQEEANERRKKEGEQR